MVGIACVDIRLQRLTETEKKKRAPFENKNFYPKFSIN
jgi:hypothetical protein